MDSLRLSPEQLRWRCDPAQFEFETTADLPPLDGTIGQDRALTAIEFGLGIRDNGFNLFVLGSPGTGRSSTIRKLLARRAGDEAVPDDWCYLHDFQDGSRPVAISLPPGQGAALKKTVELMIARLTEELPRVFEGKEIELARNRISQEHQDAQKQLFQQLEELASAEGFLLQRSVSGLVLVPVRNNEPLSQQDYENLPEEERAVYDRKGEKLQNQLNETLRQVRELEKEMRVRQLQAEKDLLLEAIGPLFDEQKKNLVDYPRVVEHFQNCQDDILERIDEFRPEQGPKIALPGLGVGEKTPSFDRFQVNLFVDNSCLEGAPVVYEPNPTYFNLFGRIEHVIQMGNATTSFTMIKPGALHRANGGYLILDCREVLLNVFTYEALKRTIRHQEIKIEDMAEQFRLIATASLKPEPVGLNCKIVLIGTPELYYLLYRLDPDFRKFFKVKADFDRMMDNTWENVQQYSSFIGAKCREEGLLPFVPSGVGRVIEYSARLIENQKRLSSRFLDIADLIREASFYAEKEAALQVDADHVELALEARLYRSNKIEQRIQEAFEEGSLLVDVHGEVVGQVNGLSVYQLGDYSFGRPSRVTGRTFIGRSGVVNIEREVKLSGPIHDKGVLILNGFFGARYAQHRPLCLAASLCFEQSYGGVDGDSASSTELYALLSSLSNLPVKQGIAVTGSVNQMGEVQPIGGVNEKIEGFFAVCKAAGLNGEQGVIIPARNRHNLMLKPEVVDAIDQGRFHVWAIDTVDQGIALLTGSPAGEELEDGSWPVGSVNARVVQRLDEMANCLQNFSREEGAGFDG